MKKKLCLITQSTANGSYKILHERTAPFVSAAFDLSVFEEWHMNHINVSQFDLLFFNKVVHIDALRLIIEAKNNNIPVVYESDDNFLTENFHEDHLVHDISAAEKVVVKKIISLADFVITYSRETYFDFCQYNANTVIFPTYHELYGSEAPEPDSSAKKKVGFMGSKWKDANFPFVTPALEMIQNKYPEVCFEFFGFIPQGAEKLNLSSVCLEYIEYSQFIRLFRDRRWTVGLAPLADTGFNRSKTNNKYREYAAAGYAGVYSNIDPYANTIIDGQTGMLADNTAESWFASLDRLLSDAELRHAIVRNAWHDMADNYKFNKYCQVKMFALTSLIESHARHNIEELVTRVQLKNKQIML